MSHEVPNGIAGCIAPPPPKATYALQPRIWNGQTPEEIIALRQRHLSAGQYHFYRVPLMLVEAKMQYCFDEKGRQYVDGYSNVCHVGHCHPHFVAQTQNALENIISNTRYLHPALANYADRLKKKLPPSLSVCYFVNSGSEANDLAIRLARVFTGRNGIICLEHAYHGTTQACTGVSTSLSTGTVKGAQDYQYCARDVHVVPVPDTFRGEHRCDDAGRKYAKYVEKVCKQNANTIGAFIHEAVQGVGGQVVFPIDYLQHAYEAVRANGGVTICDEVQTGFGRTGTHFWAFEAQGVVPDILTLGKPIGNGFPLGAVVCRREIAQAFDGVQYFNTNGGNPVACAAGMAVLDIIERDGLQKNALDMSRALMAKLRALMSAHRLIGDVRGVGLFIGVELVLDRITLEPAREETSEAMELCRVYGLLVGKGGAHGNVLRFKPPMCINIQDVDFIARTIDRVLSDIEQAHRRKDGDLQRNGMPISYNPPVGCHTADAWPAKGESDPLELLSGGHTTPPSGIPRKLRSLVRDSMTRHSGALDDSARRRSRNGASPRAELASPQQHIPPQLETLVRDSLRRSGTKVTRDDSYDDENTSDSGRPATTRRERFRLIA